MVGETKRLIDELVRIRAEGRPERVHFVKVHLVMKGIDPDRYDAFSKDDPDTVQELRAMIAQVRTEMGRTR